MLEQKSKAMKPDIPCIASCLRYLVSLQNHLLIFIDQAGCDLEKQQPFKSQPSFTGLLISWRKKKMDSCKNSCSLVT